MYRMLRDGAQYALLAFIYVRYALGLTSNRALRDAYITWSRVHPAGLPPNVLAMMPQLLRDMADYPEPPTADDMIENLQAQLDTKRPATDDRTLIDTMIATLAIPFQSRIDRTKLNALKKAILTPNEAGKLRDELQRAEMTCYSCAMPLRSEELVTFYMEEGTFMPRMYCYRCMTPRFVACHNCTDGALTIDRKFYIGQTTKCTKHDEAPERLTFTGARARAQVVPEPALFQQMNARAEDIFPTAGMPPMTVTPRGIELDDLDEDDGEL